MYVHSCLQQDPADVIAALQQQLHDEKRRTRRIEMDVREEVTREMAQQLIEIEETYT